MRQDCRERFPRHRLQRETLVGDPGMHHVTCVMHMPWCMLRSLTRGGENVPGIPGACATHNFAYLVRGPLFQYKDKTVVWPSHFNNENSYTGKDSFLYRYGSLLLRNTCISQMTAGTKSLHNQPKVTLSGLIILSCKVWTRAIKWFFLGVLNQLWTRTLSLSTSSRKRAN